MKILYIIGAGFSKAQYQGLPITGEVLKQISIADFLDFDEKQSVKKMITDMSTQERFSADDCSNFEKVYDYASSWGLIPGEHHFAKTTILKSLHVFLKPSEDAETYLYNKFLTNKCDSEDVIATTNYDILIDRAIFEREKIHINYKKEIFNSAEGRINYGFSPTEVVGIGPTPHLKIDQSSILLLKLHGSFNWRSSSTARLSKAGESLTGSTISKSDIDATKLAISRKFVELKYGEGFIRPGLSKNKQIETSELFTKIWDCFRMELDRCDGIIIIGSSVMNSQTDPYLRELIEKSGKKWIYIETKDVDKFEKWLNSNRFLDVLRLYIKKYIPWK